MMSMNDNVSRETMLRRHRSRREYAVRCDCGDTPIYVKWHGLYFIRCDCGRETLCSYRRKIDAKLAWEQKITNMNVTLEGWRR